MRPAAHVKQTLKNRSRLIAIQFLIILLALSLGGGFDKLYGSDEEKANSCNQLGCTKQSSCRDIFGHHAPGLAIDVSMVNNQPLCSFGVHFEPTSGAVIGDTNNLVGALHNNLLKASKEEGATVFSPLGAFYRSDGEWQKLPPLFIKALYRAGPDDQNCVIHYHAESPSKPPLVLLKLGGLWLGDKKEKIFNQYGEASEIREFQDGSTAYIFALNKEKRAYLTIEVFPMDKEFVWSIQISAEEKNQLNGLMGIGLGSTESELLSVFGTPSERTAMKDLPGEFLRYNGRNYSFELNEKKMVRSIKVIVPESVMNYVDR